LLGSFFLLELNVFALVSEPDFFLVLVVYFPLGFKSTLCATCPELSGPSAAACHTEPVTLDDILCADFGASLSDRSALSASGGRGWGLFFPSARGERSPERNHPPWTVWFFDDVYLEWDFAPFGFFWERGRLNSNPELVLLPFICIIMY